MMVWKGRWTMAKKPAEDGVVVREDQRCRCRAPRQARALREILTLGLASPARVATGLLLRRLAWSASVATSSCGSLAIETRIGSILAPRSAATMSSAVVIPEFSK